MIGLLLYFPEVDTSVRIGAALEQEYSRKLFAANHHPYFLCHERERVSPKDEMDIEGQPVTNGSLYLEDERQ